MRLICLNPDSLHPGASPPQAPLVAPGTYSAQLYAISGGEASALGESQSFEVKPVNPAPEGTSYSDVMAFYGEVADLYREVDHAIDEIGSVRDLLSRMQAAAVSAPGTSPSLFADLDDFGKNLTQLQTQLTGDPVRTELYEPTAPSIGSKISNAAGHWTPWSTTKPATQTQRSDYETAKSDFTSVRGQLDTLLNEELEKLEAELEAAAAPSWR